MIQSIKQEIQKGLDLLNNENWNEAIAYLQTLRNQSSSDSYIYYLESFALQEINLVDKAQESLQVALKIDPQVRLNIQSLFKQEDSPVAQIIKCEHLVSQQKYTDAMVICAQILNTKPKYIPAIYQRASIIFLQNKIFESNKEIEKIFQIKNDYLLAYLRKSNIFEKFENYEEAMKFLIKAQELHPLQKCIYFQKSKLLELQYKFRESSFNYDLLLQIDKTDSQIYIDRGKCLIQHKEYETAIWCFEKAMTLVPDQRYDLSILKGQALVKLKRYEDALELFNYCVNSNPYKYEGYLQKSYAFYEMKDFEIALIQCDKVLEIKQDIKEAHILKGNIIFKLYFSIDAIQHYDYVIQNFEDNLEAQLLKFRALKILDLSNEAEQFTPTLIQAIQHNLKYIPKLPFEQIQLIIQLLVVEQEKDLLQEVLNFIKSIEQDFNINDKEYEILFEQIEALKIISFKKDHYFLRSFQLLIESDFEQSIKFIDLAIKQESDNFNFKLQKYTNLFNANLTIQAENYLETLLLEISKDIDLIVILAIHLKGFKFYYEALIVLEKAVELMPDNFFIQERKLNLINMLD